MATQSTVLRFPGLALITPLLAATSALADSGRLNVDADVGLGAPFTGRYGTTVHSRLGAAQALGGHLVLGLDYQLFRPFAIELLGGAGFQVIPPITNAYNDEPERYSVAPHLYLGVGPRLRFLDDTPGDNLWLSAHAGLNLFDGPQLGLDAALGYQLTLGGPLSVGPFARGAIMFDAGPQGRHSVLATVGLSASFDVVPFAASPPDVSGADSDADRDGIPDDRDLAPNDREDIDGFEDQDGAPDPDNDHDGVLDGADRCPNQPGMSTRQGCPPPPVVDRDGDGIADPSDGAPEQPEDQDGFEDQDGIPEPDNDQDGIVDTSDACPLEPGVQQERGCPLKDGDGDGVVDRTDNCPADAGPADNQGCPAANKQLVVVTREALTILDMVYFDTGTASIQARSFPLLDQVAGIIRDKTWIKQLRVEGHTDSQGVPARNQALSQARAQAVRDYLIKQGVEASRLLAAGYGQDQPVQSNATARGRAANRRVELKVVEAE